MSGKWIRTPSESEFPHAAEAVVPVKPSLQALWLVEDAAQDPATGKINITGLFDQIEVSRPATHFTAPAFLFFALTEVHGQVDLALRYVDLSDLSLFVERLLSVASADPLASTVVCVAAPPMPVPHAGVYAWELWWQNDIIGSSRIVAQVS
jgi:hypothetical protein